MSTFFFSSSLDKELVRLVEEKRARESEEYSSKPAIIITTTAVNNNIQVKPIIETIPTTQPTPVAATSVSDTMNINDKIDDLLR